MSTLYIRLPSKSAADSTAQWLELACPFALVSHDGSIKQEGAVPLSDLSGMVAKAQRVVALLAASDVTLLRIQVPPLSPARLKAALPNLVEDQLISDPSGYVVAAGALSDGLRTVAVVQRDWLELLSRKLIALGARRITALPAPLCLPYQPGSVTAAINEQVAGIDVMLRLSERDGIGLAIDAAQNETAAHEVIQTLCALVPEAPVTLYVPQSKVRIYQEIIGQTTALTKRINVLSDGWPNWITGARDTTLDLMTALNAGSRPQLNWRVWRWPLVLTAAILFINITALNIDWWRMKREASALRATMIQIYQSVYPKESVIIDPIAQMRQKFAIAKHDSGLPSPDDFTAISAAFGEAWASVMPVKAGLAIAALEYRERSLFVRFKPVLSRIEGPDAEAPSQQMKAALAERNLSLDLIPAQSAAAVWQIRSMR